MRRLRGSKSTPSIQFATNATSLAAIGTIQGDPCGGGRNTIRGDVRNFPILFVLVSGAAGALVTVACSGDSSVTDSDSGAPDSGTPPALLDGASEASLDASPADGSLPDGASHEDHRCPQAPPSLDAGGACGTMEFGAPEVQFRANSFDVPEAGGFLPPGIYDAVDAERLSAKGTWRETFVVDGAGRFTRIRQIHSGLDGSDAGPVTRRSGTYTTNGNYITLTYDCAFAGDESVDAGRDTLPYEILADEACSNVSYRFGASLVRFTLKRRQ